MAIFKQAPALISAALVILGCLVPVSSCAYLQVGSQWPITLSEKAKSLNEYHGPTSDGAVEIYGTCHQAAPLKPAKHAKLDGVLNDLYSKEFFQRKAVASLAAAIRAP